MLLMLQNNPLQAQQARPAKEPSRFVLSAVNLNGVEVPPLYYVELKPGPNDKLVEEYVEFTIGENSLRYRVRVPFKPPVWLYAKKIGPRGEESYEPYLKVPVESSNADLLLVFYNDDKGNLLHRFVENSSSVHPPGTVRLINLSTTRAAFTAGGGPMLVQPGKDEVIKPVTEADGQFPLVCSIEIANGQAYEFPKRLIQFRRPGNRLLVVLSALAFDEQTGEMTQDGVPVTKRVYRTEPVMLPDTVSGIMEKGSSSAAHFERLRRIFGRLEAGIIRFSAAEKMINSRGSLQRDWARSRSCLPVNLSISRFTVSQSHASFLSI